MKKIKFEEYKIRASQASKINSGTIGLTSAQKATLSKHLKRKNGFENEQCDENGKPYKALTENMTNEMNSLLEIQKNPSLPNGLKTEIKKIYRAEKFNRNFSHQTKYTMKGLMQENEAITVYQRYLREIKGVNRLLTKNTKRLENDWFSGEHDIEPFFVDEDTKCGVDIKCSWNLDTFPLADDKLDENYICQNNVYMDLNGVDMWLTVHVLVNVPESLLHDQKQKHHKMYPSAYDNPDDPNYETLIKGLKG